MTFLVLQKTIFLTKLLVSITLDFLSKIQNLALIFGIDLAQPHSEVNSATQICSAVLPSLLHTELCPQLSKRVHFPAWWESLL